MTIRIDDPTFFTAFTLIEGAETAMLDGAPEACNVSIKHLAESGSEDIKRLAQDIAAALQGQLDSSAPVSADPDGQIVVACG